MTEWKTIDTAPKDGRVIRYRRVHSGVTIFEGDAVWKTVTFPDTQPHPITGIVDPGFTATGWMCVDQERRVPEPTHWAPPPKD